MKYPANTAGQKDNDQTREQSATHQVVFVPCRVSLELLEGDDLAARYAGHLALIWQPYIHHHNGLPFTVQKAFQFPGADVWYLEAGFAMSGGT
jgi:hypothetical protein